MKHNNAFQEIFCINEGLGSNQIIYPLPVAGSYLNFFLWLPLPRVLFPPVRAVYPENIDSVALKADQFEIRS